MVKLVITNRFELGYLHTALCVCPTYKEAEVKINTHCGIAAVRDAMTAFNVEVFKYYGAHADPLKNSYELNKYTALLELLGLSWKPGDNFIWGNVELDNGSPTVIAVVGTDFDILTMVEDEDDNVESMSYCWTLMVK